MHNPHISRDDIEEAVEVTDYDLLIKYKNGKRVVYDVFRNQYRYIEYDNENLTDQEWVYEFKLRLRNMMRRKHITQAEVAERVGVSQVMISKYVRGESIPDFIMLKKLAKALRCSVEDFYYKHY